MTVVHFRLETKVRCGHLERRLFVASIMSPRHHVLFCGMLGVFLLLNGPSLQLLIAEFFYIYILWKGGGGEEGAMCVGKEVG